MAQGDPRNRSATLTEAHIGEVDQRFVSPGERANYIWSLLKSEHPELTDWDVICFAGEFLGMMSNVHLWLQDPTKRVVGLIYAAHYMNAEQIDAESSIKRGPATTGDKSPDRKERGQSIAESQGDSDRVIRTRFST